MPEGEERRMMSIVQRPGTGRTRERIQMTLLADLRNLIVRRRPEAIDDARTPDVRPVDVSGVDLHSINGGLADDLADRFGRIDDRLDAQSAETRHLSQQIELLPGKLDELHPPAPSGDLAPLERLERLDRLSELDRLERLDQLDQLSQLDGLRQLDRLEALGRLDRLDELDQLPQLAGTVSEIGTRSAGVVEALEGHIAETRKRADALEATLAGVAETAGRDDEALAAIRQQVESNARAIRKAGEMTETVGRGLHEIVESSNRLTGAMGALQQSAAQREESIARLMASNKRSLMFVAIACTLASVTAMVIAAMAMLK